MVVAPAMSTIAPLIAPKIDEQVLTDTDQELADSECAHIVRTGPGESAAAKVTEARVFGTPIEALCGYTWVPSKNPRNLPVCPKCKDIYDTYRAFNDGLNETPND
jgi:hypothetical protein